MPQPSISNLGMVFIYGYAIGGPPAKESLQQVVAALEDAERTGEEVNSRPKEDEGGAQQRLQQWPCEKCDAVRHPLHRYNLT